MVDRISSLPDEVLCHILSFLKTKDSVRTTILSTRWMYLFTRVPILYFDFPYNSTDITRSIDFVNGFFLMYNVSQMIKFRVWCMLPVLPFDAIPKNLCVWISSAISRNLRELIIGGGIQRLPRILFFSTTLSALKLGSIFDFKIPSSASLPCLKTLHLELVCFGSSAKRILSVCPVLEDLSLISCDLENVDVLDISHPTLKILCIVDCTNDYVLILNAPSLLLFNFINLRINGIISETVSTSLVKGHICISNEPSYGSQIPNNSKALLMKLVDVVSHARRLYLSKSLLEAFRGSYEALPTFCNLTRLEVAHVSMELLPYLLNRSSHLKVLIFAMGFNKEEYATDLRGFENLPSCVSENLNEIVFNEFSMKEIEIQLVEYFLKNAKVLDKMIIHPCRMMSIEERYELSKKLLRFSKFSRDCQIVL